MSLFGRPASTEQANAASEGLDHLSTEACLRLMNQQDQQVTQAVAQAITALVPLVDAVTEAFRRGGRLFYVGAGTSGRLGVLDASECPPTFSVDSDQVQGIIAGGDWALRHAVEGAEDQAELAEQDAARCQWTGNDVVVGLSASGGAQYVCRALALANQMPVLATGCVTSVADSALVQLARYPVVVETGAEVLAGSTRLKAGTAQKLVLNMLSTASMVALGKTYGNRMVDLRATNHKLRLRAQRLVCEIAQVTPEHAEWLLQQTDYRVKPAIVMARLGGTVDQADARLAAVQGQLRQVIG